MSDSHVETLIWKKSREDKERISSMRQSIPFSIGKKVFPKVSLMQQTFTKHWNPPDCLLLMKTEMKWHSVYHRLTQGMTKKEGRPHISYYFEIFVFNLSLWENTPKAKINHVANTIKSNQTWLTATCNDVRLVAQVNWVSLMTPGFCRKKAMRWGSFSTKSCRTARPSSQKLFW